MTAALLTTKLYIPPIHPDPVTGLGMRLVSRPRLIERLNAGLYRGLTLVSSPAGFGKTTLLSEWAAECGRPVAWLSLDEGDNDPARFWTYFVAALQTVDTTIGRGVPGAFQASPPMSMETLLTALINEISAAPDHFALVLDDYHLITAQPIHDGITFLLDHLPPNLHLALATRADPPLPVARLRGQGQLTELRQSDLRFTVKEAAAFLNDVMGLDLSMEDVAALEARTEGWIAGLQMASLAMQAHLPQARGPHEATAFIRAFTGSDRYVLDYLVEQVLQRQPEHVQTFLLQTSMLDRLAGPLCDAVLQIGGSGGLRAGASLVDSQAVLEYLERNNLFVVPLDNERRWYRYHHLFADLLRYRLRRVHPELLPVLHGRAGAWYEERGLIAEAIDHALAAGDSEWAAHLVEQAAESTMLRSEFATLLGWVEALPEDQVHALPRLCVYQALALVFNGQPLDLAQSCLQRAVEVDADGAVAGEVTAFRALIAAYRGERDRSAELSRQALDLLPEASLFFRSFVAGFLGLAYLYIGDMETATRAFEEAVRVSEKMGNLTISVLARCHLAELAMLQGRVREAELFYEQALEAVVDEQGRWLPIAGVALTGLGRIALEQYDLEAAERYLTEGIELAERWSVAGAINGYIDLARARQVQGNGRGALEAIQTAQRLAEKFDALEIDDISVALCQARLWVAQGNLEAAARWIEERGLDQDLDMEVLKEEIKDGSSLYRLVEYATVALVRIAQDRPGDALRVLRPLLGAAADAGWVAYHIEVLALEALALQAQGDVAQALAALEQALSLAEPGRFVRMFVEKGPPMARLLYQAAAGGITPEFAGRLLAAFPALEAPAQAGASAAEMVEPLSGREMEVLRLIAEGLSNQEIAQRLFISLRTVKWHSSNIYGKLGVKNRTQAVARARSLGLLPAV